MRTAMETSSKVDSETHVLESSHIQNFHVVDELPEQLRMSAHNFFSSGTGIYTSLFKPQQLPPDSNLDIVSFIFSHKHGGTVALTDSQSGFSISYSRLREMVKSLRSGLQRMGLSRGQVVLLFLRNTVYFPVILLAILSLGAVVTAMNPLSSSAEIKKQMNDTNPVIAFTSPQFSNKIKEMVRDIVLIPDELILDSPLFNRFQELMSSDALGAPSTIIHQQDTALILYSSGTTGASKGVMITHGNLIAMVRLFVQFEASLYQTPSWDNVYLAAIPMFHVYGLSLFATGLLSIGSEIVVMRRFDVKEMVKTIDRYRVTHFPLVPSIVSALASVKSSDRIDLRCLKQVSSGGAPLMKRTLEEFLERFPFVDFIQGYGMTETAAVGTRGFNTKRFKKYLSVGLLAPNTQARVVDLGSGSYLPPGNSGELWLYGPGIMKGYLNNPHATSSTIDLDGWLHTGDIVYFDKDGFLYITGRLKEMIKYKGFQVSPLELENVLVSHPDIIEAGVTAIEDRETGELPVAYVVRKPGSGISSADVIDYVAQQVAPFKKIREVRFIDSLRRSPAGKVLRSELRKGWAARL